MMLDRLSTEENRTTNRMPWQLGPLVAIALLAAALAFWQLRSTTATAPPPWALSAGEVAGTIELVIEIAPDQRHVYKNLPWQPGMTVLHALQQAENESPPLQFTTQGEGANTFVIEIAGFRNEGGGAEAKNWLFFRNGEPAFASCAVQAVESGDTILWKFTKLE